MDLIDRTAMSAADTEAPDDADRRPITVLILSPGGRRDPEGLDA